jgi:Family of unknown function (DUF6444)
MDTPSTLPQDLWDRIPPEARPYIETLQGQVQTLTSMVHTLQEQVRTLQEQLNQTSRNSSCPPSRDPPQSPRPRRPRGPRRRGGPPGHPGHTRLWLPVEEADEVVGLKPAQCTHCQAPLSGDDGSVTNHGADTYPSRQGRIKLVEGHHAGCAALHPNLLNINVVCAMCLSGCLPCYDPTGMRTFPRQSHSPWICYASLRTRRIESGDTSRPYVPCTQLRCVVPSLVPRRTDARSIRDVEPQAHSLR